MSKNIVVCYDGTGNEYGKNNTNVVKIFESIIFDESQVGLYDPGVGTFSIWGKTFGRKTGVLLGKAFGIGLRQNIEDGYAYLMDQFEPGDKVFIYGFSRGAFTARALAGMIHYFGLLQKGSNNLIPYVSKLYNQKKLELASDFKKTFCQDCKPHLIGVWDTVASLGHLFGKKFFDQELNEDIQNAYHAVSVDEKRTKFSVNLWDITNKTATQNIEQVWFPGVHSDVGGGYEERNLSDITFAWMMDNSVKHGLRLQPNWRSTLKQDFEGKLHRSRRGLWKLWKKTHRNIPPYAKVHQSVFDRMKANLEYHPENIKEGSSYDIISNESYTK